MRDDIKQTEALKIIERFLLDNKMEVHVDEWSDFDKLQKILKIYEERIKNLKVLAEYKAWLYINKLLEEILYKSYEIERLDIKKLTDLLSKVTTKFQSVIQEVHKDKSVDVEEEIKQIEEELLRKFQVHQEAKNEDHSKQQ